MRHQWKEGPHERSPEALGHLEVEQRRRTQQKLRSSQREGKKPREGSVMEPKRHSFKKEDVAICVECSSEVT